MPIGRTSAGAIPLAVDKINNDPSLTALRTMGYNFTYTWRDTHCEVGMGLSQLIDLWTGKDNLYNPVDVFIGKYISNILITNHLTM